MVFDADLAVAQVALIPLIVGVIEALKRFFPTSHSNIWFGLSLLLGVAFQVAAYVATVGLPSGFTAYFSLVVMGLAFGLASGKAYDEAVGGGE